MTFEVRFHKNAKLSSLPGVVVTAWLSTAGKNENLISNAVVEAWVYNTQKYTIQETLLTDYEERESRVCIVAIAGRGRESCGEWEWRSLRCSSCYRRQLIWISTAQNVQCMSLAPGEREENLCHNQTVPCDKVVKSLSCPRPTKTTHDVWMSPEKVMLSTQLPSS